LLREKKRRNIGLDGCDGDGMASEKEMTELLTAIRQNLEALTRTVSDLSQETAGLQADIRKRTVRLADSVADAGERLAAEAADIGTEALRAGSNRAGRALKDLEQDIERNPKSAILVGLGLLIALGVIFRR
jgi:cell division septum initiation protein DivIVA